MADDIVTRLRLRAAYATDDYLSYAAADEIEQLRALVASQEAEIERLRRLGDTMAYFVRAGDGTEMFAAVHAWQEARRG